MSENPPSGLPAAAASDESGFARAVMALRERFDPEAHAIEWDVLYEEVERLRAQNKAASDAWQQRIKATEHALNERTWLRTWALDLLKKGDKVSRHSELGRTQVEVLLELLEDVAVSGVAFEDPRIKYVEVQLDRSTWDDIQALYSARPQPQPSDDTGGDRG